MGAGGGAVAVSPTATATGLSGFLDGLDRAVSPARTAPHQCDRQSAAEHSQRYGEAGSGVAGVL